MFYYLDIESQIKRMSQKLDMLRVIENCATKNSSILKDITDGELYNRLLSTGIGNLI